MHTCMYLSIIALKKAAQAHKQVFSSEIFSSEWDKILPVLLGDWVKTLPTEKMADKEADKKSAAKNISSKLPSKLLQTRARANVV